jgi:hypothetical protein
LSNKVNTLVQRDLAENKEETQNIVKKRNECKSGIDTCSFNEW